MSREAVHRELSEGHQWTRAMAEASRFSFRLIAILASLALLWIAFSWFIVPAIIASAYRGESFPLLNDIISGQAIHPLEDYLADWEMISWRALGMLVLVGLTPLPLVATGPEVQRYLEARYSNALALNPLITNTILALIWTGARFLPLLPSPGGLRLHPYCR